MTRRNLVLISLLLTVPTGGSAQPAPPPQPAVELAPSALGQIAALKRAKAARSPVERKLGSGLLRELRRRAGQPLALPHLRRPDFLERGGAVEVDVYGDVDERTVAAVTNGGGEILGGGAGLGSLRALVPWGRLLSLAARGEIGSIRVARPPVTNKVDTSEGDVAHAAATARASFGVDGTGVKIGVISDSVEALASLQASGDLPAVAILPGQAGSGSSEGTAMLEIVHDLAPGAELQFATALGGEAQFAQNILDLQAAGCPSTAPGSRGPLTPPSGPFSPEKRVAAREPAQSRARQTRPSRHDPCCPLP